MNTGNVGQYAVDQEIRASKGTAGDDFGLILRCVAWWASVGRRRACILPK